MGDIAQIPVAAVVDKRRLGDHHSPCTLQTLQQPRRTHRAVLKPMTVVILWEALETVCQRRGSRLHRALLDRMYRYLKASPVRLNNALIQFFLSRVEPA